MIDEMPYEEFHLDIGQHEQQEVPPHLTAEPSALQVIKEVLFIAVSFVTVMFYPFIH